MSQYFTVIACILWCAAEMKTGFHRDSFVFSCAQLLRKSYPLFEASVALEFLIGKVDLS